MLCQLHRREVCRVEVGFLSSLGGCIEHSEESLPAMFSKASWLGLLLLERVLPEHFTSCRVQLDR